MKKLVYIYLFLLFSSNSFAQKFLWVNEVKGSGSNHYFSSCFDNQENLIVVGRAQGAVDYVFQDNTVLNSGGFGSHDKFLTKFDQNGNEIFSLSSGGASSDISYGVDVDQFDNIYVSGTMSTTATFYDINGDTTITHGDGGNVFIIKYTPFGEFEWIKVFGAINTLGSLSATGGLAVDDNGRTFISGIIRDTVEIDGTTYISEDGSDDAFLMSIDANGNHLWTKLAGGPLNDRGSKVRCISNNSIVWFGRYWTSASFDGFTLSLPGRNDFLSKLDYLGNYAWVEDTPKAISNEGGLYVNDDKIFYSGSGNSKVLFGVFDTSGISINSWDFDKLNPNSNGTSDGIYYDTMNYEMLIACKVEDTLIKGTDTLYGGESDAVLAAFDTLGNLSWQKRVPGYNGNPGKWTVGRDVKIDSSGFIYFLGEYVFNGEFDQITKTAPSTPDVFIGKLSPYIDVQLSTNVLQVCQNDTVTFYLDQRGIIDNINPIFYGGTIINSYQDSIVVQYDTVGVHDIYYSFSNQWESKFNLLEDIIEVLPRPVSGLDSVITICPEDSLLLEPTSGYQQYSWSGMFQTSVQNIWAKDSGKYMLDMIDVNGCANSDTISMQYFVLPQLNLADTGICNTDSLILSLNIGGVTDYLWSDSQTSGNATFNNTGNYILEITDINSCVKKDTFEIIQYPDPLIDWNQDFEELCENESPIPMNFTPGGGNIGGAYLGQFIDPEWSGVGNHWVSYSVTNTYGCTDSVEVPYIVYTAPDTGSVIQNDSILAASIQGDSYQWYLNGNPISNSNSQYQTIQSDGFYSVEVYNAFGCSSISSPYAVSYSDLDSYYSPKITIYPNPAKNYIHISHAMKAEELNYKITSIQGKVQIEGLVSETKPIFVGELSKGTYLLHLKYKGSSVVKRVIVQ